MIRKKRCPQASFVLLHEHSDKFVVGSIGFPAAARFHFLHEVGPHIKHQVAQHVVSSAHRAPASVQGSEDIPQFGRMEGTGIVTRQLLLEVIYVAWLIGVFITVLSEGDTALIQCGFLAVLIFLLEEIIGSAADDIGNVMNVVTLNAFIKSFRHDPAVNDRSKRQPIGMFCQLRQDRHQFFRRNLAHFPHIGTAA